MSHIKPSVILTQRYADAVAYASVLHGSQTRKGTNVPYVSHLLGASSLILEAGGDEDMAIAGLLHDGPEDQGGRKTLDMIRELFGERVATIVEGCTDSFAEDPEEKDDWGKRKRSYIAHLREANVDTLTVSLADKTHNARAIVTDLRITGPSMWTRFTANCEEILWYYSQLLEIGQQRLGKHFLVTILSDAVQQMRELTPPMFNADSTQTGRYAMSYNAYERWFADLGTVSSMLEPIRAQYDKTGQIPEDVGVDALRAWLFVLVRAERFTSGLAVSKPGVFVMTEAPQNPLVGDVLEALREKVL